MSSCDFNIWTDMFIPLIISPILLLLKVLYDKWVDKKSKTRLLKNKLKLEKIQNKLTKFYWPIYIRLLRDFDIWSRFTIYDNDFYDFIESDTESDVESSEDIKRCCYRQEKITKNSKVEYIKCNIPIHINSNTKGPLYCLRHHKYSHIQNIEIINYNKDENTKLEIPISMNNINDGNIILNIDMIDKCVDLKINKSIENDLDSIDSNNSIPGNLSGNKIGEIRELDHFSSENQINIDSDIYKSLVTTLLTNYEHINSLIIDNISIAEPNTQIGKQLIRFMKFSTIIKALINSDKSIDPNKYNSPYPKKLLPIVEKQVFILQKQYNKLIKNYYYK